MEKMDSIKNDKERNKKMKFIKNILLEIVTLILLVINLYMFLIQCDVAKIQQTTQEEFDAFWSGLSIVSLVFLVIVVALYIISIKAFKRTIGKTLSGAIILLAANVIILALTNATTVLIFVAVIMYVVYLIQAVINAKKNN